MILPPTPFFFGLVIGLSLLWKWPKRGVAVLIFCTAGLLVAASPWFSIWLVNMNGTIHPIDLETAKTAQAIVVLGGGRNWSPEYDSQYTVNRNTLVRLRYGAYLHKRTGLPLLVTGGLFAEEGDTVSEALLMARSLEEDFNIKPKWLEKEGRTTWEGARYTREILRKPEHNKIIVVTQAFHMRRSVQAFEAFGFEVLPAPTDFANDQRHRTWRLLIPTAGALNTTSIVCHEVLGRLWYRLIDWAM